MHTSFHMGWGAVSSSNGFNCSLVGSSMKANLTCTEKSLYISLQCNLPQFFLYLIFHEIENSSSTILQMWVYTSVCACPWVILKTLRGSSALAGCELLKSSTLPFLTLFNSKLLPSLHPSLSTLSSLCLPLFYSPKISPSPLHPVLYFVLSLNADIIYQSSSSRLISQHKSLSLVHPSLTLRQRPSSSLRPKSFHPVPHFVGSYSVCDE